jgi:AraC-like DNA-binding protein
MTNRQHIVQRASEFFHNHIAEAIRVGDISRDVGVSERTLRNAFQREHGMSPKQFDRHERLLAVRQALCTFGASETITSVASQYGFFELGRFAGLYKHVFGESPSETIRLRRGRAAARQRGSRVRSTSSRTIDAQRDKHDAVRSNPSAILVNT